MLKAVIFELYGVMIKSKAEPVMPPYMIDLIWDLHKHGIKLFVTSLLSGNEMQKILEPFSIAFYIEATVPMKEIERTAFVLDQTIRPRDCILLTASQEGIDLANQAGMISIGYSDPHLSAPALWRAALLVEGFDEIDHTFLEQVHQDYHDDVPKTIVTTDRLLIREFIPSDFDALYAIWQEPDIRCYLEGFTNNYTIEKAKFTAYIQNIYPYYGYGLWGVFLKTKEQLIGQCGIELKNRKDTAVHEIGYLIGKQYRGKGYAKECVNAVISYAFDKLSAPRILAVIDKRNLKSIRFAEQNGMTYVEDRKGNHRICAVYERKPEAKPEA